MNDQKRQLWQAYLDGELSAGESAEFEASLSDAERAQLASDMRIERALSERLSEDSECPDDVWSRTCALVEAQNPGAAFSSDRGRRWRLGAASLAAAASIAFFISQYSLQLSDPDYSPVIMAATTIQELAESSEVEPGVDSAEQFLQQSGIDLSLVDDYHVDGKHNRVKVLGARSSSLEGDAVTEMLVSCCGFPIKVVLAKRDSAAAREIGLATAEESDIKSTRVVGDYLAAIVGHHWTHGVWDLFGG